MQSVDLGYCLLNSKKEIHRPEKGNFQKKVSSQDYCQELQVSLADLRNRRGSWTHPLGLMSFTNLRSGLGKMLHLLDSQQCAQRLFSFDHMIKLSHWTLI